MLFLCGLLWIKQEIGFSYSFKKRLLHKLTALIVIKGYINNKY